MEITLVHQRHSEQRALQRLGCVETSEPPADNDNMMLLFHDILIKFIETNLGSKSLISRRERGHCRAGLNCEMRADLAVAYP